MSPIAMLNEIAPTAFMPSLTEATSLKVQTLSSGQEKEVLAFLGARPIHTVFMAGLIRDNGLVNSLNRGVFYCCRDAEGSLEGVALIGHVTVIEAWSEAAFQALSRKTQECSSAYLILGEQEKIDHFWHYYATEGESPRRACRELLLEQRWPVEVREAVRDLRLATPEDLKLVIPVHAAMALEESGINPLKVDPEGFRQRCARRVEQGRVWVWVEQGQLIFKADVMADTPETVYLEGIYVSPEKRGKGYGLRCVSQLSRILLERAGSVCLLVNELNEPARQLYQRAGYKVRAHYDTIYVQNKNYCEKAN